MNIRRVDDKSYYRIRVAEVLQKGGSVFEETEIIPDRFKQTV